MVSGVIVLVAMTGAAAVEQKRSLRHHERSVNLVDEHRLALRPLWPITALVLTARELQPLGRVQHLRHQLESLSIPFRVTDGDYAGRYSSLQEQFEELSVEPHLRSAWMGGRAQNDLLKQDLIGSADVFCDIAACLKQPNCICVRDAEALPADSLLSIMATHRNAWQSIADNASNSNNSWHLLLEDDAELLPIASAEYFGSFNVPAEADLVWLYRGAYQARCWPHKDEENVLMSGPVFNTSDYNGVAYAITKAGARRLLRHVPQDGSPVDVAMSRAVGSCGLKAFCPPNGRYPVSDSRFQHETTRLALNKENMELDELPSQPSSFLQLTATGHAAGLHRPHLLSAAPAAALPRRRVQCPPNDDDS